VIESCSELGQVVLKIFLLAGIERLHPARRAVEGRRGPRQSRMQLGDAPIHGLPIVGARAEGRTQRASHQASHRRRIDAHLARPKGLRSAGLLGNESGLVGTVGGDSCQPSKNSIHPLRVDLATMKGIEQSAQLSLLEP
jgi:hypothetical protein